MNYHQLILMGSTGSGDAGGAGILFWVGYLGLIFAIMYFLMIRPQRKKQKEHDALLQELKKGDRVVTTGGMFGTVFAIDEDRSRIVLEVGKETRMEFLKSSIAARVEK